MGRDPVFERLLTGFEAESKEICASLARGVVELEQDLEPLVRARLYEEVARGLHTLKGNSDSLGFPDLAELAHKMEDLVVPLRRAERIMPAATGDILLRGIDALVKRLSAHVARGAHDPAVLHGGPAPAIDADPEVVAVIAALARAAGTAAPAPRPPPTKPPLPQPPPERPVTPVEDRVTEESWRVATRNVVALVRDVERMREIRLRLDERRREVERALLDVADTRSDWDPRDVRMRLQALRRAISTDSAETGELVDSLENEVKAITSLPLRTILDPLHRAVRDLCRTLGKRAQLSIVGAELSLDRRILEALQAPLVHLVRNAVDHGIEAPAERDAAGKHRDGAIVIRAEQSGNILTIEVEDDGRGFDPEQIRAEALASGVHDGDALAAMTASELQRLLFRPGFSTKGEVTEISGRGIGLDVVRNRVQAMQGHVDAASVKGDGTRFVITIPAELGSSPVIIIRIADQQLGIPMLAIETVRALRTAEVEVGAGGMTLDHQAHRLPLHDLAALLGLRPPRPPEDRQPVLVVQVRGQRVAVTVDGLIGDREVLVRRLPGALPDLRAYQGAATLARGELLLVLRAEWLVEPRVVAAPRPSLRALVVDDSITARALHRTMLESGGITVHTSSAALDALDQLRRSAYDVVICDLEMEPVSGYDLVAALREDPLTRDLPVILVSTHDTEADRARGESAGADAFLSKTECVSGRLLEEIVAVIARRRGAA